MCIKHNQNLENNKSRKSSSKKPVALTDAEQERAKMVEMSAKPAHGEVLTEFDCTENIATFCKQITEDFERGQLQARIEL